MSFRLFFYDKDGNEKEIEAKEAELEWECMGGKFKWTFKKMDCPWCEGKANIKPCPVCHDKNHISYDLREWKKREG